MTKEKQIQDELEKFLISLRNQINRFDKLERYWGQMDGVEKDISDIRRMLKWLIAEQIHTDKDVVDEMRLKAECNQPDIMDIFEGKDEGD